MSTLSHEPTAQPVGVTSALPLEADSTLCPNDVRLGPVSDMACSLDRQSYPTSTGRGDRLPFSDMVGSHGNAIPCADMGRSVSSPTGARYASMQCA